jgi:hypothetical protein
MPRVVKQKPGHFFSCVIPTNSNPTSPSQCFTLCQNIPSPFPAGERPVYVRKDRIHTTNAHHPQLNGLRLSILSIESATPRLAALVRLRPYHLPDLPDRHSTQQGCGSVPFAWLLVARSLFPPLALAHYNHLVRPISISNLPVSLNGPSFQRTIK